MATAFHKLAAADPALHDQLDAVDAFDACANASDRCILACLDESYTLERERFMLVCRDSVLVCRMMASFIARGSDLVSIFYEAAAEVCKACAAGCSKYDGKAYCECAAECRHCQQLCRHFLGTAMGRFEERL